MTKYPLSKRGAANEGRSIRVGVDTGGTFTDFVFEVKGRLQIFKLASTPADPSLAITEGLRRIAEITSVTLGDVEVVHGTTVGTNALLQRRGARTALVTTKGFEDVLVIGRQARPELYNLNATRPPPLVPDNLRLGVRERVAASGEVLESLDENELAALVEKLKKARVEAVAVSLLFSFVHPEHEQRIAAALALLYVPLSISHQILPEYREYERTSTVAINAYLQPLMGKYLNSLKSQVSGLKLRVMQSSGGSISATAAADEPVRTILSGPSGGVVGALRAARAGGFQNIITFDMGGTSTDVALCDRDGLRMTNEATVAGLPVAVSVMDIHTVGAGGGSIARVDEGGSLRVGPESAGAEPGPACYGRSLLPTVTDAHVVLNHFGGAGLLGGEFKLDERRAQTALASLAREMSKAAQRKVSIKEAAQGVLSVVNTNMERALRRISGRQRRERSEPDCDAGNQARHPCKARTTFQRDGTRGRRDATPRRVRLFQTTPRAIPRDALQRPVLRAGDQEDPHGHRRELSSRASRSLRLCAGSEPGGDRQRAFAIDRDCREVKTASPASFAQACVCETEWLRRDIS